MRINQKIGIVIVAALLAMPALGMAGKHAKHEGKCGKACMEMCPMMMKDADLKVENTADGVTISITSKDAAVVKKIQEQAVACRTACQAKQVEPAKGQDEMVVCPVMGSKIPKSKAAAVREYKGKTYYLCCQECIGEFDKNPDKYAK